MIRTYPDLRRYSAPALESKVEYLSGALGADPQQVGAILTRAPRALGASIGALDARLAALDALLLTPQGGSPGRGGARSQAELLGLVGRLPWLLTLAPHHLDSRLSSLCQELGMGRTKVVDAVLRHPPLLQSRNRIPFKLDTIATLLALGVEALPSSSNSGGTPESCAADGRPAAAANPRAAAAALALRHPQLLCYSPRALHAKFESLQASSGLPPEAIAATLRSQPLLLVAAQEKGQEGRQSGVQPPYNSSAWRC